MGRARARSSRSSPGIIEPTEGTIAVDGRVSSLLMLGAGFDPDLSGRDNIALAGAFMGIDHADMLARTPGIVALADIGQFIDAPIKTYSSGMNARLGFSIATAVDPDVLLLDEVLSTGDATFRAKSQERVIELMRAARAIVLVTHDMHWAVEFCNRAVLLEHGNIVAAGTPQDVADHPRGSLGAPASRASARAPARRSSRDSTPSRDGRADRRRIVAPAPRGLEVLVVGWFPASDDPVKGRFIADQAEALDAHRAVRPTVVSFEPLGSAGDGRCGPAAAEAWPAGRHGRGRDRPCPGADRRRPGRRPSRSCASG